MTVPVFIVGNGRTGSCWLGRILADHPEIDGRVEQEPQFGFATKAAMSEGADRTGALLELCETYDAELKECPLPFLADKSHPNLWNMGVLRCAFAGARFIGIRRMRTPCVDSMVKHEGVAGRCVDYPSAGSHRFLGVGSIGLYSRISLRARCELRWAAHELELGKQHQYNKDMHLLQYESLCAKPAETLARLQRFLKLKQPFPMPEVRRI